MGAAASIDVTHVPGIKEAYEKKKAEESITDEALFEFMNLYIAGLEKPAETAPVEAAAGETAETAPVEAAVGESAPVVEGETSAEAPEPVAEATETVEAPAAAEEPTAA